ncbi:HAMP domain-containing histidine kinase [Winogradskyella sp. DF17]|uniref:histidine kinase n=1 Tax=Winogradskyella pelagia TaxID=2819984 RepID=A0ABS3T542_9FLAO|nr:HAMP domain-containing sensor histidine kinase [Winogradskyella sp. DF17]MBO3117868.1 HAMP domain-containing histidine kinase [Winogradskyella sp. DF17]
MITNKNRNVIRWIIIFSSFAIISLILWNTYVFFQNFKAEERAKMKNWSFAQKELSKTQDLSSDVGELPFEIIASNKTTPMISVASDGSMDYRNIEEEKAQDSLYLLKLIEKFKNENKPIEIRYQDKVLSTLYYGNSPLLNKLKYYPLALVLIIFLFGAVVYFFYRSTKNAEQNKLWTGMAKETAHQIGTPLSSLVGWAEILKTENVNAEYIKEIEKDIDRLKTITDRFSKIGSLPTLEQLDVVEMTKSSFDYLKSRSSKLINFEINCPDSEITAMLNAQLFSWTIENLVKNAIDAMKGKGNLELNLNATDKNVLINISDTGKGIPKNQFKKVFEPGYTTKSRGWGLGLSLAKRIIEDYHDGKIKVLESEPDKGTTIQISLKTL